jgi:hypothetical protein
LNQFNINVAKSKAADMMIDALETTLLDDLTEVQKRSYGRWRGCVMNAHPPS